MSATATTPAAATTTTMILDNINEENNSVMENTITPVPAPASALMTDVSPAVIIKRKSLVSNTRVDKENNTHRDGGSGGGGRNDEDNATTTSDETTAGTQQQQQQQHVVKRTALVRRTVIDEALVMQALKDERLMMAADDTMTIGDDNVTVDLTELSVLMLSFRNIQRIDNLYGYESLTKLHLDNNVIERIENLGHLVNLKWLDLSFNNITKIEGLDSLTQLTDLSLNNNQITVIEGVEKLVHLNVLSLDKNQIQDLSSIPTLRKLKSLRMLSLRDNPCCASDEYRPRVLAMLTQLKYIDFQFVEPQQIQDAHDQLYDVLNLADLEEREKSQLAIDEQQRQRAELQERAQHANLVGIDGFFEDILLDDHEHSKVQTLPGFDEVLQVYQQSFCATLEDFMGVMFEKQQEKEKECALFKAAMTGILQKKEAKCIEYMQAYDATRKRALQLYEKSAKCGNADADILEKVQADLLTLCDTLMELELMLVDQMNSILNEFETNYRVLVTATLNEIKSTFRALEDVAGGYAHNLNELVSKLLLQFQNDEFDDTIEFAHLLSDKEIIMNCVNNSNDTHLTRIVQKGDELEVNEENNATTLIQSLRDAEYNRNRRRIVEIENTSAREREAIAQIITCDESRDQFVM